MEDGKKLHALIRAGNISGLQRYFAKEREGSGDTTEGIFPDQEKGRAMGKDRHGQPPLHIAIEAKIDNRVAVIKTLLEYGGGTYFYSVDRSKWTPLHVACSYGYLDVIDFLLSGTPYSAPVDAKSVDDSTPLHYFVRHPPPAQSSGKRSGASAIRRKLSLKDSQNKEKFSSVELYFHLLTQLIGSSHDGSPHGNINAINSNRETPLHIACGKFANGSVIQMLLEYGANINALTKHGDAPLHIAVRAGNTEAVEALISRGADLLMKGAQSELPKQMAVNTQAEALLEIFSKYEKHPNKGGDTEVTSSPRKNSKDSKPVNKGKSDSDKEKDKEKEKEKEKSHTSKDGKKTSTLRGSKKKPSGAEEILMPRDRDKLSNSTTLKPKTAPREKRRDHEEIKIGKVGRSVSLSLKPASGEAYPSLILGESDRSFLRRLSEEKDRHGRPHLHLAIESDRLEVVKYLALFPERPIWHITDRNGWSPLHVACHLGNIPLINFLLHNTDPHPVDTVSIDRSTPLHYFVRHPLPSSSVCSREEYFSILTLLLGPSEKATTLSSASPAPSTEHANQVTYRNINAPNKYGDTPLHVAVSKAVSPDIILFLISHQASVNAQNTYGETCLHSAVRAQSPELIRLLVENGGDLRIRGRLGTPKEIAQEAKLQEIVRLIDALDPGSCASAVTKETDNSSRPMSGPSASPSEERRQPAVLQGNVAQPQTSIQSGNTSIPDSLLRDEEEMQKVLEQLGLSCYIALLKEEAIGMKALRLLSEQDLISLGIKLGHRRILLDYLKNEKENVVKALAQVAPEVTETAKPKTLKSEESKKFSADFSVLIQLDDLTLSKHLGTGSCGDVYKGKLRGMTTVAIKKLVGVNQAAFLREAQIMEGLPNHPNVVNFYGIAMAADSIYIVVEYLRKGSLEKYLRTHQSQIDQKVLIQMAKDIVTGMEHLASNDIVHRDLAARNLLLDREGRIKVCDFGQSRPTEDTGYYVSDNPKIPIRWTAPEALLHHKYSSLSDVWSFGVVLYELFTYGQLPYPAFSNKKVMSKVTKGYRMPKPPNCPDEVYELMLACWKEEPTERPSWFQTYKQLSRIEKKAKKILTTSTTSTDSGASGSTPASFSPTDEFERAAEQYDIYASLPTELG